MNERIWLLVLLFACGGKAEPSTTPLPPESTAVPGGPPASDGMGGGLSPEVVSAVQGVPMLVAVRGLFLFSAERVQAEELVAGWAQRSGLMVVPPKQTDAILQRALRGQHVTTGQACGAPLFEFQAVQRWRAELGARGKLEVGVDCSPDCVMQVSVSIGTGGEGGTEFFAAPFDPTKPWTAELAARLPTIVDNGGHDRHGHLNNPVQIAGIPRNSAVPDRIVDADKHAELAAGETAAAVACLGTDRFAVATVEYDAAGKLARCEPAPEFLAGALDCVCRAIAGHTGTPNAHERIEVTGSHEAVVTTKDKLVVRAFASPAMIPDGSTGLYKPMTTDPAIEQWSPPERADLAPCFADVVGGGKLDGRATVTFDAVGKATAVTAIATTGTFTPAQQACARDAFLKVRAPCPSAAGAQATAEIHVEFDKPAP